MTEAATCNSCNKKVSSIENTTQFKCPSCKKTTIVRCGHCREIVAKYKCPECGFVGPN